MKKNSTFFLKLIVGLSLMLFLFSRIEWTEFIYTIKRINPIYIYINTILFFFPGVWLSVLKWKKLLLVQNIDLPFKQLYLYYLIGTFLNNFLPSTIGGDVSRVLYLTRVTNKPAEITASIILERFTGLLAIIFLGVLSVLLNLSFVIRHPLLLYLVSLLFSIGIVFYLLLGNYKLKRHFQNLRFLIPFWKKADELFGVINNFRNHKNVLLSALIISIIFVLFGVFATYLFFMSIAIEVPILELILITSLVQLIGILPISINSIGLTEGSYIILFGLIGISSVDALTVALLGRILMILISLSGGIVFIFRNQFIQHSQL
ncbi:hypothetical protein METP3_00653 [Methanosarcinales archaeon]|nr:hypothetical protein METP3_00653 [Methanosarcinales archaeon]